MPTDRILLEVGTGNDWHGGDYTKAAMRAVEDAIHHCSLPLLHTLNIDPRTMRVEVTIGVQRPERVDPERVQAVLPEGIVTVHAVMGGLDIPNQGGGDVSVIANAAIVVHLDVGRR
ncbi:MAG: Lin0512 family protein [Acetobacteraceae bacterium]